MAKACAYSCQYIVCGGMLASVNSVNQNHGEWRHDSDTFVQTQLVYPLGTQTSRLLLSGWTRWSTSLMCEGVTSLARNGMIKQNTARLQSLLLMCCVFSERELYAIACLSVCCLSFVTFVRPTQAVQIFF